MTVAEIEKNVQKEKIKISRTISECRICGNKNLESIINLGYQPLTGVFPKSAAECPSVSPLDLLACAPLSEDDKVCGLVQLRDNADMEEMYGTTYGYFSSISPTMVSHLTTIYEDIKKLVNLEKNDYVLDIGCNDGTLLSFYRNDNVNRVGIDPSSEKFHHMFDKDIKVAFEFFGESAVRNIVGDKQFKAISSIAMFYDIDDPTQFMREISNLLTSDGIWALEIAYLPLMMKNLAYDQIMHEHLTYLGLKQMDWMAKEAGLKIVNVSQNNINGGSIRIFMAKADSTVSRNDTVIDACFEEEAAFDTFAPYKRFSNRIKNHKDDVNDYLDILRATGRKVYGYGASTKGNVIQNYCKITGDSLTAISDRNPEKPGLVTPGMHLPIISHDEMRTNKPDYLIVFIWHFRKEVIRDELEYLKEGGKLVFILPRLHVVDANNYERYLESDFDDLAYGL
jgi:NDP-4-keto-2,6-dideoxyhexose 3-C-methyltransferase